MRCIFALALAASLASVSEAQVVYSETWDDGAGASRWSAPIVDSELATFDGSVNYAFDYGAVGIPAAPGGGSSIGAQFFANKTDESAGDEGESIAIIANGATMPAGDFTLTAEVYYRVLPGSEDVATEYITLGAFTAAPNAPGDFGLNDDAPFRFSVSNGNGLAWQVTGDGGSATDLVRFQDPGNANAGSQNGLGALDDIPFGTIPGVTTGAGNPNNPFEQYGLQNRWVTLSIESAAAMISYKINGATINTIDNTLGTFSGGSIMIGLNDAFNSAAGEGVYTVFDNVKLTAVIPEPATAALALLGLGAFAARRR
jgi:hypothetical protein